MIKRPRWDESEVTVGIADTLKPAVDAKIEHGDMVYLQIGDLKIVVRVQEGGIEKSLKTGEYVGIVRSMEGTTKEPVDLNVGDKVAFKRRNVFAINKGSVEGGWT